MKKLLLAGVLSASIYAADNDLYNNSVSLTGGYSINTAESDLDNDTNIGMRYNYNRDTDEGTIDVDSIQFAYDHTGDDTYQNPSKGVKDGKTSIDRFGANAVWYIENDSDITPYALAGAGIQVLGDDPAKDTNNVLFGAVGAGAEYQLRGDMSVVAEGKALFAGDNQAYLMSNVGFKYSFGQNYDTHDVTFIEDGEENQDEAR